MFLEILDLKMAYPGQIRPAVDGVSFGLSPGQIGVLLGPSGCGKTSLLRAVAGLETPQQGQILLDKHPISRSGFVLPPEKRQMGMVFQDYALFPHLDVNRNIGFGITGRQGSERQQRIREVLGLVGLQGLGTRYPHELSGGQQQRVALARALAPGPRLLLLDEPFSNLDIELRERLAQELRDILKATGTTALLVTHDQLEAFAVGDVVGVMEHGRLHQWDEAYGLYHRPATRFVADFIGQGVFLPAQIYNTPNGVVASTPLGTLSDLEECPWPSAYPQGRCEVLLRPDDLVLDAHSPVQAEVQQRAFRGANFLYTLKLDSGHQVLAHAPSHQAYAIGERVGLRPEVKHLVTFAPL